MANNLIDRKQRNNYIIDNIPKITDNEINEIYNKLIEKKVLKKTK